MTDNSIESELHGSSFRVDDQLYTYWAKCEDVAIHFNELIIKMRTQVLSTITIIGTLLGVLSRMPEQGSPHNTIAIGFALLLLAWLGVGCIDALYYGRLLKGAVDEIVRVEEMTKGAIQLSKKIDTSCGVKHLPDGARSASWCGGKHRHCNGAVFGRILFYSLPAVGLLGATIYFCLQPS